MGRISRPGACRNSSLLVLASFGVLAVRCLTPPASTAAPHLTAETGLRSQHFGPPRPLDLGDGSWRGLERIGIAGVDAHRDTERDGSSSRQLHHLSGLCAEAERQALLVELEERRMAFETTLDTVDAQATFMCRVTEGGVPMDTDLAKQAEPICDRLLAYVRERFECESACISEVLIRRYLPTERRRLEAHFDVSAFATAIVSLTPESEYSGGLYVQAVPGVQSRRYVDLESGDALVHRFDTMHGVHVPSGARYSLVVWFSDSPASLAAGAAPWVRRAAEGGNAEAQFILGGFHYRGDEFGYGASDMRLAVRWYATAARRGNPLAQVHLGSLISAGELEGDLLHQAISAAEMDEQDGSSSSKAVVQLYRQAAEQGHPTAEFALGRCYLNGEGVACDEDLGREWLQRAAAQGADENVAAAWAADELARLADR